MTQQSNPHMPPDGTFQLQPDRQLPPINDLLHSDYQTFPSNILQSQPDTRMSLSSILQSQPDPQMSHIPGQLPPPDPQEYVRARTPDPRPVANRANSFDSMPNLDVSYHLLEEMQKNLLESVPFLATRARGLDGGHHRWRLSSKRFGREALGSGRPKIYARHSVIISAYMTLIDYRKTTSEVLQMLREVCIKSIGGGHQDTTQILQQLQNIITSVERAMEFHGTVLYSPPSLPLDSAEHEGYEQ
jgi:hypothetical protein